MPASAVLVGGDPGIGKSTLLLQAAASFAERGLGCIYVSGEEATAQVRMRAQRLGLAHTPVRLAAETNLREILGLYDRGRLSYRAQSQALDLCACVFYGG